MYDDDLGDGDSSYWDSFSSVSGDDGSSSSSISGADWTKGIILSVLASIIGGVSKIAIRKSWLMEKEQQQQQLQQQNEGSQRILQQRDGNHGGDNDDGCINNDGGEEGDRVDGSGEGEVINTTPAGQHQEYYPPSLLTPTTTTTTGEVSGGARATTLARGMDGHHRSSSSASVSSSSTSSSQEQQRRHLLLDNNNNNGTTTNATTTIHHHQSSHPLYFPKVIRGIGMIGMSILNPICCVWAMNYASPSILAPFSGLTLVWVIVLSPMINQEVPTIQAQVACTLIIVGEVIVALFGDHTNDEGVTVDDILESYQQPAFLTYFGVVILYEALLWYWIMGPKRSSSSSLSPWFGSSSATLKRFAWGSAGGTMTGMQNFLKDALTVLKASQQEGAQDISSTMTRLLSSSSTTTVTSASNSPTSSSLHWSFYLFLALAGLTALLGLLVLTAAMKRYDATYCAASFVGSFVVSASLMSVVHYDTFGQLHSTVNYILYPTGLLILMIGVMVLVQDTDDSTGAATNDHNDDNDINDDDEDRNIPSENNDGIFREGSRGRTNSTLENEQIFGYTQVEESANDGIP